MIPGPTEVPWRVVRAMAQPAMIQYEPPFDEEILEPACLDLRQVFQTSGEVLALPGSGRTALEATAISLVEPGDRVVVVVAGVFGAHGHVVDPVRGQGRRGVRCGVPEARCFAGR